MLRRFEADARRARALNIETIRRIVRDNQDTEFGRAHGFADLDLGSSIASYVAAVPLQSYGDIADQVTRMAAGEENVLCAETPTLFAMSSGTSGKPKLVPTTPSLQKLQVRYYGGLIPAVTGQRIPGGGDPHRGVLLLSAADSGLRTPGGTRMDSSSAAGVARMERLMPMLWTTPFPGYTVADRAACWYLHALFALRERETKFLHTAFCPTLVGWLADIERDWDSLLGDIADGTLSDMLQLSAAERAALASYLRADPARADELRRAVKPSVGGFDGFVPRAWPWMRYAAAIITGSFAAYLPNLRRYIGPDLPVYTTVYIASEAILGINLWPEQPERYALAIGAAGFEFIPADQMDQDAPRAVGLEALEVGEQYEVVLTNSAGFYRYRLTDVVKVVDFFHELPVISFSYRRGGLLDLVGERLTEGHTLDAVQGFIARWGGASASLVDYTATRDTASVPPRYVFYIEVAGADDVDPSDAWQHLDAALTEHCHPYKLYARAKNRIDVPAVKLLKPGGFDRLIEYRLAANPGASRNQMKVPRVLENDELIAVLDAQVMAESGR